MLSAAAAAAAAVAPSAGCDSLQAAPASEELRSSRKK